MTKNDRPDPQSILKRHLARNPRATLHEIRAAHPLFQGMSLDHLGVRVSRIIDQAAHERA